MNKVVGITTGDHFGIGAEVISKGLHLLFKKKEIKNPEDVLIFGSPKLYIPFKKFLPKNWAVYSDRELFSNSFELRKNHLNFITPELPSKLGRKQTADFLCGRYIEVAVKAIQASKIAAISTGPIDKNALKRGGYAFDGHTEFLQSLSRSSSVTMMMASPKMRITLVTTHIPLNRVAEKLTKEKIVRCLEHTVESLKNDFGIKQPKIAVLGLNPHAGDQGLFGKEEEKIILPAINKFNRNFPETAVGPFPADGFFALWEKKYRHLFDAIVCMYHDQGLIPIKLYDFDNTVNLTLGLPIVRTSVDHGVGFDIAGKNIADPSSFISALRLAKQIIRRRKI